MPGPWIQSTYHRLTGTGLLRRVIRKSRLAIKPYLISDPLEMSLNSELHWPRDDWSAFYLSLQRGWKAVSIKSAYAASPAWDVWHSIAVWAISASGGAVWACKRPKWRWACRISTLVSRHPPNFQESGGVFEDTTGSVSSICLDP
jgi:hypothetical protein